MTDCNPMKQYGDTLDVYEYRLMAHYHDLGVCYESTRTTAQRLKMSAATVSRTRARLIEGGYITARRMTLDELKERGLLEAVRGHGRAEVYAITVADKYSTAVSEATTVAVSNSKDGTVAEVSTSEAKTASVADSNKEKSLVDNDSTSGDGSVGVEKIARARESQSPEVVQEPDDPRPRDVAWGLGMGWTPNQYSQKTEKAHAHPLVIAYLGALPEGARPPISDRYLDVALSLEAKGYTAQQVGDLVSDRVARGRTDYAFAWCIQDLPGFLAKSTPSSPRATSKPPAPMPPREPTPHLYLQRPPTRKAVP